MQKGEISALTNRIEEMGSKVQELEEKANTIEAASLSYKNSLTAKSLQIVQKEQEINKLNEEIKGLKSGSKAGELVCFYLINRKARATQEIEKLKADRQSLVQRSNENLTKARQKNIDLVTKNKDLGKQIAALQVVTLR